MLMATRDRETDEAMSDKELIDEVLTLIVAGHETTAAALTWTWYLHQPAPGHGGAAAGRSRRTAADRTLGLDAAESLQFTHQVLQEALRLYPPGWLITRRTLEADELGGYPIAPRTDVFISPYMLHRHPAFWSEPERVQARTLRRRRCRGDGIDSPTFPSRWARGIASARTWPCSRCWCMSTPCRAAFG